jgi:outer membrane protein
MNRYFVLGCLGIGLMVSPLLGGIGQTAVPANPKVGMIDIEKTLAETPAGKRANEAFEKLRKAKQAELDKHQTDLKKAAADLEKQAAVLKPDVLQAKKEELQKQFVALQQTYAKLEQDLAGERAKLIEELLKKAEPMIKEIAKSEGVTVIFEREAMVWWDPAIDLTAKLEAKLQ